MIPMDKAHAEALVNKHAALEALLDNEEHRPHPDDYLVARLKKEKLRIKEEIERLRDGGSYAGGMGASFS